MALNQRGTANPNYRHGLTGTPEYWAFRDAMFRCTNPKSTSWKNYGARGIRFLFTSFEHFMAELGPRPAGLTLDRIESTGNYEPGNVRWATWKTQHSNRRAHKTGRKQSPLRPQVIALFEQGETISAIATTLAINEGRVRGMLNRAGVHFRKMNKETSK